MYVNKFLSARSICYQVRLKRQHNVVDCRADSTAGSSLVLYLLQYLLTCWQYLQNLSTPLSVEAVTFAGVNHTKGAALYQLSQHFKSCTTFGEVELMKQITSEVMWASRAFEKLDAHVSPSPGDPSKCIISFVVKERRFPYSLNLGSKFGATMKETTLVCALLLLQAQ